MLTRKPVVAGSFYPGQKQTLKSEVDAYLANGRQRVGERAAENEIWGLMLPHAGHIYCGDVIGDTLAGSPLPPRLIILCPNHTGYGRPLGVWPEGVWLTPLGEVPVDAALAREILAAGGGFEPDVDSHLGEHSIEVLLPFLQEEAARQGMTNLAIVPISVGVRDPRILKAAGRALAKVLATHDEAGDKVGVIISSDMNHYDSHETTLAKDELALAKARASDPDGLLDVTNRERISMCGAPALALALYAGQELGGLDVALTSHSTSGAVSGDYDRVVGYAGLRMRKSGRA